MDTSAEKLSSVINSFDQFYKLYTNVSKERDEYFQKLNCYKSENERLQKANEKLQADLNNIHEMIGNFHQQIIETDVLKEKNRDLQEKYRTLEQEMKSKEEQFQEKCQQLLKENKEQLAVMIQSKQKDADVERQRLMDLAEDRNAEISQLRENLANATKEKEDAITVLSMEYENKLAKIQRQKSQILQTTQQTTNQDIFRKKLQHLKKTHAEEVAGLKEQVRQLQERQTAATRQQTGAQVTQSSANFASVFSTGGKGK